MQLRSTVVDSDAPHAAAHGGAVRGAHGCRKGRWEGGAALDGALPLCALGVGDHDTLLWTPATPAA
eukprot:gene52000-11683_t